MHELFDSGDILEAMEHYSLKNYSSRHCEDDFLSDVDDFCPSEDFILLEHSSEDTFAQFLSSGGSFDDFEGEDMWAKFQLDEVSSQDIVDLPKLSSSLESLSEGSPGAIRHHDCMWAGKCSSSEHGAAALTPPSSPSPLAAGHQCNKRAHHRPSPAPNSRSLLVSRQPQSAPCKLQQAKLAVGKCVRERMQQQQQQQRLLDSEGEEQRPETPVSDFDEHHNTSLFGALEESSDESSYMSDENDSRMKRDGVFNDHSYHIVRASSKTAMADSLGVQTPSDSEEEIDVVSLGEKCGVPMIIKSTPTPIPTPIRHPKPITTVVRSEPIATSRGHRTPASHLPTNPSPSDKRSLQISMAMAVKKTPSMPPIKLRLSKRSSAATTAAASTSSSTEADSDTAPETTRRVGKQRKVYTKRTPVAEVVTSPRKRPARSAGSDSEDSSGKRSLHNTMERQRRVDLRNAFEQLRVLIPKLETTEKAPKVNILKEAGLYCRTLQSQDITLTRKQSELRRKQSQLRDRLTALRRSLAMYR